MHQPNWTVIAAVLATAAVAAGFVARTVALDASPLSNSASRSAASSSIAAKSTTFAATFPEANRAAKGNRLSVIIPEKPVGTAIEKTTKDRDSWSVQSRAPREGERKPVVHCEPVGSPLADPAILNMPPRRCFALLGTLPKYTLLGSVALRAEAEASVDVSALSLLMAHGGSNAALRS
jgi:hypothetical protein